MCADHERGDAPNPHVGVEAGENVHADDADDVLGRLRDEHGIVGAPTHQLQAAENEARMG